MKSELLKTLWLASLGLLAASPAWSHHSTAMFDYAKTESVTGTVKDFQWTNPHSYIQVLVPDGKGGHTEWSIEIGTPTHMARLGWSKQSLKPGDQVTISFAPMKDGSHAGTVKTATLADGRVLVGQNSELTPAGPGPARGTAPPLFPTLERATPKQP